MNREECMDEESSWMGWATYLRGELYGLLNMDHPSAAGISPATERLLLVAYLAMDQAVETETEDLMP